MARQYIIDELYRLRMLLAGIYTGIGISSTIGFSLFTEFMKAKYGFDQRQITTISTTGNCVGYLSFLSGVLFDFAGPKVVLPVAGALGCLGFLLFGLAFDDVIPKKESSNTNMIQFCIFLTIVYFGSPSIDVATIMPLMLNFPRERGYVVIIQKTFSGLGTSILMAYFNGWFLNMEDRSQSSYSGYAYFVACQLLLVTIVGAVLIDLPPYYMTIYRRNKLLKKAARLEAYQRGEMSFPDGELPPELKEAQEAAAELEERKQITQLYLKQDTIPVRVWVGCGLVIVMLIIVTLTSIITAYVPTTKQAYIGITIVIIFFLCCFSVIALPFQFLGAYPVIHKRHPKFYGIGIIDDGEESMQELEFKSQADETACKAEPAALEDEIYAGVAAKGPNRGG
ncbi:hypothetical protein AGDE_07305 [Angomonas deanei]|nr:hypothetical protein AGDE_07305 [Angomonas deanei]|eukprot:EPY35479.1 hypothetical protein AGDE_07305 [Angomonas deanei]